MSSFKAFFFFFFKAFFSFNAAYKGGSSVSNLLRTMRMWYVNCRYAPSEHYSLKKAEQHKEWRFRIFAG